MKEPTPSPLQATPLMVDGKLFFCTQTNVVFALDPETGKQAWRFDPKVDPTGGSVVRACRGVSYHDGAPGLANGTAPFCARRIITATFSAKLIALDSQTGKPCPTFGTGGFVDLKEGQGEVVPGFYYVSSAPAIVRGTIVVGGWVADNVSTDEPSGVIRGYDVDTGKRRWAWDAGNPGNHNGPPAGQWYTRSTPNSWAPMSVDEQLGLVYVPTGNATPDHFGGLRSAASLKYGSSVVALDAASGELLATLTSTTFCRADGGFGGPTGPVKTVHELPTRAADHSVDFATQPRAALIYRLSGDYNPLHAEPAVASAAGFKRPILHGLATYGIAGWAVVKQVCGGDPAAMQSLDVRFSSPVYPGETIRTELWVDGKVVSFRARAVERDILVLNNGRAELR